MEHGPYSSPSMTGGGRTRYRSVEVPTALAEESPTTHRRSYISQDIDTAPDTDAPEAYDDAVQKQLEQDEQEEISRSQKSPDFKSVEKAASTLNRLSALIASFSPSKSLTQAVTTSAVRSSPPRAPVAFMGGGRASDGVAQDAASPGEAQAPQLNKKRSTPSDVEDEDDNEYASEISVDHSAKRRKVVGEENAQILRDDLAPMTPPTPTRSSLPRAAVPDDSPQTSRHKGTPAFGLKQQIPKKSSGTRESSTSKAHAKPIGAAARQSRNRAAKEAILPQQYSVRPSRHQDERPGNIHPAQSSRSSTQLSKKPNRAKESTTGTSRPRGRPRKHNSPAVEIEIPSRTKQTTDKSSSSESYSDTSEDSDDFSGATEDSGAASILASAGRQTRSSTTSMAQKKRLSARSTKQLLNSRRQDTEIMHNGRSHERIEEDNSNRSAGRRIKGKGKSANPTMNENSADDDPLLQTYSKAHAWTRKYSNDDIISKIGKKAWSELARLRTAVKSKASVDVISEKLSRLSDIIGSIVRDELHYGEKYPPEESYSGTTDDLNKRRCTILEDMYKYLLPGVILVLEAVDDLPHFAKDKHLADIAVKLTSLAIDLIKPGLYKANPMRQSVEPLFKGEYTQLNTSLADAKRHFGEIGKSLRVKEQDAAIMLRAQKMRLQGNSHEKRLADEAKERARAINKQIYEQITLKKYKLEESYRRQFEEYRASQQPTSPLMEPFEPPRLHIDLDADSYDDDDQDFTNDNDDIEMADEQVDAERLSELGFEHEGDYFQLPGEDFERLEMPGFGSRDQIRKKSAGPWHDEELQALCQGLETYQGNDRYPKILDEWGKAGGPLADRDMDEIFEQAKEIKALLVKVAATEGTPIEDWLLSV